MASSNSKQIFYSIEVQTGKAITTVGDLRKAIKLMEDQLFALSKAGQNVGDKAFDELTAKIKGAKTELQSFLDTTKAAPSFTEKLAKAIKLGMTDVVLQTKKAEDEIKNLTSQQQRLASAIANTNNAAKKNELVNEFKKVEAEIKKTQGELNNLNQTLEKGFNESNQTVNSWGNKITDTFKQVGLAVVAAFAVNKIVDFGKACVASFAEAELSGKKLQAAVSANGGLQSDFKRLEEQAGELQKTTIFNDEAIEDAQTLALQFGLNADQVEKLIPKIVDYASATGQELIPALEGILKGADGSAKALKAYGINLEDTKNKQQNLAQITDQLTAKFDGQGKLVGESTTGRLAILANTFDEIKESIGGGLINLFGGLIDTLGDLTTPAKSAAEAFHDQNKSVQDLEKNILPLLNRYDELKKKTTLSKEEHIELNKIIQLVGNKLPQAATEFDRYGNAIDISTAKGREFLRVQKLILEQKNAEALKAERVALFDLRKEQERYLAALNRGKRTEVTTGGAGGIGGFNTTATEVDLTTKELNDLQVKLKEVQNVISGKEGLIKELLGEPAEVKQTADIAEGIIKKLGDLNKLSNDELLAGKKELLQVNSILADDEITRINSIIDAREKANKKSITDQKNAQEKLIADGERISAKASEDAFAEAKARLEKQSQDEITEKIAQYERDGETSKAAARDLAAEIISIKIAEKEKEKVLFKDDPVKLAEIETQLAALRTDYGNKELDFKKYLNTEKEKLDQEAAKKKTEIEKQAHEATLQAEANTLEGLIQISAQYLARQNEQQIAANSEKLNKDLEALDIQQQKEEGTYVAKTATQKKYEAKKKEINEKAHKEELKLKHDSAVKEKIAAIVSSVIQMFLGVAKAAASLPPPYNAVPIAAAYEIGLLNTALIAATPLAFRRGVIDFDGEGTQDNDQNIVRISDGESVINAKSTAMFKDQLRIINDIGNGVGSLNGQGIRNIGRAAYAQGYIPSTSQNNSSSPLSVDMSGIGIMIENQNAFFQAELSKVRFAKVSEHEISTSQFRSRKIENTSLLNT